MRTTVLATDSAMPNTMPADQSHPKALAIRAPRAVATSALRDRARDRDPPDGEKLLDVELQADAEHEQDDADLGELLGDPAVGDESGCVRAHQDSREQVADDRRQADALRDVAQNEGGVTARRPASESGRGCAPSDRSPSRGDTLN